MRFLFILFIMLIYSFGFSHEMIVKDVVGRTVKSPEKVERVLALGPGALRFLTYVGAQDMLVGRELFEEKLSKPLRPYTFALSSNFQNLPVVSAGGPGKMPDIEKVLLARPDVIFTVGFTPAQADDLQYKAKSPVICLSYGDIGHADLETVKESLRLVGYVTHSQKRSQDLVNKMALLKGDLVARTEGVEPKSVFMASVAFKGTREFNSSEKQHPVCNLLGVNNIADKAPSQSGTHVTLQLEKILEEQPEYIFYDVTGLEILKNTYSDKYPMMKLLKAENSGNIYTILPYNWYNTNIENLFLTAYFMGKVMYPNRFNDVDIAHYADDIYNTFLDTHPFESIIKKFPAYRRMIFEESGVTYSK